MHFYEKILKSPSSENLLKYDVSYFALILKNREDALSTTFQNNISLGPPLSDTGQ